MLHLPTTFKWKLRDDEYFEILTNFKGASHYSSVLKKYHFDEKQFLH